MICSLAMLAVIAVLPLAGVSGLWARDNQTLRPAPANPDFLELWQQPPQDFYGYIPAPVDLSHLDAIPVEGAGGLATLPSSFDWRDHSKVTPIRDQNPCGTCWAHGPLAAVESRVLIQESASYNFSEQNLICCTDPAWVYLTGNHCVGGGWPSLAADTLTKIGTRLEACQPYNTDTIDSEACHDGCQTIKRITDYRMIADQATAPDVIAPLKDAVYNHGPLVISYAADDGTRMCPGSIYYWPDCPRNEVNHIACIVGWDDTIAHPSGGGSGAWIIKNSWGTDWGDDGFFYLCYGSAGMCEVASLDYKDYDADERLYYWDEAGQVNAVGYDAPSAWMANIFTSTQNGSLTHVDFWTTSNNAEYEIYIYLDGNITDGLRDQAGYQTGSCQEFGYYSIALTEPVPLTSGQPFTIAVKMTTPGHDYPIPIEEEIPDWVEPPIQSGVSYARYGDGGVWEDLGTHGYNACLRARVKSKAAGQPNITVSPASFNVTLGLNTTQGYTLLISNDGDADLSYNISDGDCPWLSESPTSGSVVPGTSHNITVTMNTTGLAEGDYSAEIVVASNDPDDNPTIVPVTLRVGLSVYNMPLSTGWNLVSPPLIPENTSMADVTAAISTAVDLIWYYCSNNATWLWYVPGHPASTLSTIEDGKGYWFLMNSPGALRGSGWELPGPGAPPAYDVFVDWNLIGFSSRTGMSPESYLATISDTYSLIYGWDAEIQIWLWYAPGNSSSTLTTMEPGYGYWLLASADGTIVPPA